MRAVGLALAILLAGACSVLGIGREAPLVGCPQALAVGTLEEVAPDRLALHTDESELVEVRWSPELSVRPGSPAELVDAAGQVVARAGDRVSLTGGYLGEDAFTQCDVVRVLPPAT